MYTVIWKPPALAALAEAWMEWPDRAAVSAASHEIDRLLTVAPLEAGEGRGGIDRIVFAGPLGVMFEVAVPARTVFVNAVGLQGRRRR